MNKTGPLIESALHSLYQKNAYALKTPRVVALPFIYGVECIIISNQNGK